MEYDSCYFKDKLTSKNTTIVAETIDFICKQSNDQNCQSKIKAYIDYWLKHFEITELDICVNDLVVEKVGEQSHHTEL